MSEESKAKLYVIRPSRLGFAMGVKVYINDEFLGKTKGGKYLEKELDPGTYSILSKAENKAIVDLTVEAGKDYYVKQIIFPGFFKARNKLEILGEDQGKAEIQSCKLIPKK